VVNLLTKFTAFLFFLVTSMDHIRDNRACHTCIQHDTIQLQILQHAIELKRTNKSAMILSAFENRLRAGLV